MSLRAASFFAFLGLALSAVVVPMLADDVRDAASTLNDVGFFAVGATGEGDDTSKGELALKVLLKQPDASAQLEHLIARASPAGQLYILLGLRVRDRAAYKRALTMYGRRSVAVETMHGCITQRESFQDLVTQIDRGDYEWFLTRRWRDGPAL